MTKKDEICEMLDEFDTLSEHLDVEQDNAHRAAWLAYNNLTFVQYAWWINSKETNMCSSCGGVSDTEYAYCPQCGAYMRIRR